MPLFFKRGVRLAYQHGGGLPLIISKSAKKVRKTERICRASRRRRLTYRTRTLGILSPTTPPPRHSYNLAAFPSFSYFCGVVGSACIRGSLLSSCFFARCFVLFFSLPRSTMKIVFLLVLTYLSFGNTCQVCERILRP